MKSPRELLRRMFSGSSSSGTKRARAESGGSDAGCDVSASGHGTNAALARTLASMGDRHGGLTLADVTGGVEDVQPRLVKRASSGASAAPSAAGETEAEEGGVIPMEEEEEAEAERTGPPPLRMTMTMSMSIRPLEEDPEWALFLPFDSLEFSFVGGSIGVTRPVPEELDDGELMVPQILDLVLPTITKVTRIRSIVASKSHRDVFLVDEPLAGKSSQQAVSPVDDLRLADQMVRLALVGKPPQYSYWFFSFWLTKDVSRILGRAEEDGADAVESGVILSKIEGMTGTRILVAPYDPASWRRCFLLLGEEELIQRARQLLQGAIAQGMAPTRENVRRMMAEHNDPNDVLIEHDARLEEIRRELKEKHGLRMVEVQRDGNCLFRALAQFEFKTEARHKEIRKLVCERLKEAPEAMEVTALVESTTPEGYLVNMGKDGSWGGCTEVMAYAEKLGRSVTLWMDNEKIGLRTTDIDGCQGAAGEAKVVRLLLYKSHYWLLKK